jgi:hypothetical protein
VSELVPLGTSVPNRKFARELLRELPRGSRVAFAGRPGDDNNGPRQVGTHPVIFLPDGSVLRDKDGKVLTVSGTPGSRGTVHTDRARIRKALASR